MLSICKHENLDFERKKNVTTSPVRPEMRLCQSRLHLRSCTPTRTLNLVILVLNHSQKLRVSYHQNYNDAHLYMVELSTVICDRFSNQQKKADRGLTFNHIQQPNSNFMNVRLKGLIPGNDLLNLELSRQRPRVSSHALGKVHDATGDSYSQTTKSHAFFIYTFENNIVQLLSFATSTPVFIRNVNQNSTTSIQT